jgi:hypothetical protein
MFVSPSFLPLAKTALGPSSPLPPVDTNPPQAPSVDTFPGVRTGRTDRPDHADRSARPLHADLTDHPSRWGAALLARTGQNQRLPRGNSKQTYAWFQEYLAPFAQDQPAHADPRKAAPVAEKAFAAFREAHQLQADVGPTDTQLQSVYSRIKRDLSLRTPRPARIDAATKEIVIDVARRNPDFGPSDIELFLFDAGYRGRFTIARIRRILDEAKPEVVAAVHGQVGARRQSARQIAAIQTLLLNNRGRSRSGADLVEEARSIPELSRLTEDSLAYHRRRFEGALRTADLQQHLASATNAALATNAMSADTPEQFEACFDEATTSLTGDDLDLDLLLPSQTPHLGAMGGGRVSTADGVSRPASVHSGIPAAPSSADEAWANTSWYAGLDHDPIARLFASEWNLVPPADRRDAFDSTDFDFALDDLFA